MTGIPITPRTIARLQAERNIRYAGVERVARFLAPPPDDIVTRLRPVAVSRSANEGADPPPTPSFAEQDMAACSCVPSDAKRAAG